MKERDQKRIVKELCGNLLAHLLENIDRVPEEWDGHELRQWMADTAASHYANMGAMCKGSQRRREYLNTCAVVNL